MLRCSFCKRSQDEVRKLISSHPSIRRVYICDDCVAACNRILASTEDDRSPSSAERDQDDTGSTPVRFADTLTIDISSPIM